ncbi:hypothetical protein C2S53_008200 [Perilla frutescens var. hirtella]|uniref:PGG domain-containing protein n=1 Tax=Perilla frutescens var. hirtella TaxID=608512 RepID=A0AAD4P3R0_PERFH|nr:hypothetical protein C2S53_008200 [Perilla frutescens var. hirtella]
MMLQQQGINLLHIATKWRKEGIVDELLNTNRWLARSLDSQQSSPLHIAAEEGWLEIAKKLSSFAPETCGWRNCQSMNPIHVAAMNGRVEILEELLPINCLAARERVYRGQTVLHLCVEYRQLGALKFLVGKLGDLVEAEDEDGETVLHWAVRSNQLEMIKYLAEGKTIIKNTMNSMGKTALKILQESPRDTTTNNYSEIETILLSLPDESEHELLKMSDTTMMVVVLIATVAFQATLSPPGGFWQDDSPTHKAGKAVMASTHPTKYQEFVAANMAAIVSSLIILFFMTTGLLSKFLLIRIFAYCAMVLSLIFIVTSYNISVTVIAPDKGTQPVLLRLIWIVVVIVMVIVMIMAFILGTSTKNEYSLVTNATPSIVESCATGPTVCFPGLWLVSITTDSYKVSENSLKVQSGIPISFDLKIKIKIVVCGCSDSDMGEGAVICRARCYRVTCDYTLQMRFWKF